MLQSRNIKNKWDKIYNNFKGDRLSVWDSDASLFCKNQIEFLRKQGVKHILDAGCGDGRNLLFFAKAGFQVTGVDISKSALKKTQKLCAQFPNVSLRYDALENLNSKYKKFDAIICDHTLVHIKKINKVINNFYQILKTGGYILLEFTSINDPLYGKGIKISKNEFIQSSMYLRFFTLPLIKKLLKNFKIISIFPQKFIQPNHGNYRKEKHTHHSLFVLAQKI